MNSIPMASALAPTYQRQNLTLVDGEGAWVRDDQGRRYLDLLAGIAVNTLGHKHPAVMEAFRSGLQGLIHVSNLYSNPPAEALAQKLCRHSFADAVFLCNSGTEAVEGAIKFARRKAPKGRLVACQGGFHGRTLGALSVTWNPKYRTPFEPLLEEVDFIPFNDVAAATEAIVEGVSAVLVEPIQGEGGITAATPEFLAAVRGRCDQTGAVLIFDEVQCGLGRTGTLWAHQAYGVEPDVMTLAKPLGGGLPIGAILMRQSVAGHLQHGDHGSTFGGGPLVATVANAVFDTVMADGFLSQVVARGRRLEAGLRTLQADHPERVLEVRGRGMMWGLQLADSFTVETAITAGHRAGLLLGSSAGNTLRLLPPLTLTADDLETGLKALGEGAVELITVRKAFIREAPAIASLINRFATQDLMLPKGELDIYQSIREYVVAVQGDELVGCGALRIMGNDLAELRSLAVSETVQGQGVGGQLVDALVLEGKHLGLRRIFALTLRPNFFARLGFQEVVKTVFPQKVWLDCRSCPKRERCDEIAVELQLSHE